MNVSIHGGNEQIEIVYKSNSIINSNSNIQPFIIELTTNSVALSKYTTISSCTTAISQSYNYENQVIKQETRGNHHCDHMNL